MKSFEIIEYGKTRSDETCKYTIKIAENVTVEQIIKDILSNKNEWGRIGIKDNNFPFFGKYSISYGYGKIVETEKEIIEYWNSIKNRKVINMEGDGGWNCSDYQIVLED